MKTFTDRIIPNEQYGVPFLKLRDRERDNAGYAGCGDCVAVVSGDRIEEIIYLDDRTPKERLNAIESMVSEPGGKTFWQGMLSCGTLCEPWFLTPETFYIVWETWEFESAA